jgi:post-segregation antitoxin (ccd killing protein)
VHRSGRLPGPVPAMRSSNCFCSVTPRRLTMSSLVVARCGVPIRQTTARPPITVISRPVIPLVAVIAWTSADDLAERARARGLNLSALTQAVIAGELERTSVATWLDSLPAVSRAVEHAAVMAALHDARDDFGW